LSARVPALAAVLVLAAALRLAHLLAFRSSPWFDHLVVDPQFYDAWAQRIAAGDWLGDRTFYMDPLYPYVLGATYAVFGRDLLLARLLNVGFSLGTCTLVWLIGRRIGGATVGTLAALGLAVYAPDIFYTTEVDKTSLSLLLTAATLAGALGTSLRARFAAGVALGLVSLTRANFLVFAPLGVLLVGRDRRPAAAIAAFVGGLALTLVPVAWRNHHVSGQWVLTTAQAGQNFYTGNNPTNPYGAYGAVPFVRGNPHFEELDFRTEAEKRAGHTLTAGEVSRFWFEAAFAHMRAQPRFATRAFLRKAALFWNDFEISDNQDQYVVARHSWVMRLPLLGFGWLFPFALLGAVVSFRIDGRVRVLCSFVLVYAAAVIAFFIFSRYRIQVVPALLPLAALGALDLAERVRRSEWRAVGRAVLLVAAAAAFSFHTFGIFARDNEYAVEMRLSHLGDIYLTAGRPDDAIAALEEAVQRCPLHCRTALGLLANAYVSGNRLERGERFLADFVRRYPTHSDGAARLASIRLEMQRRLTLGAPSPTLESPP
jgi:4-amino-4-deoxy-L-arabinose transferase-like glycosyltransferase